MKNRWPIIQDKKVMGDLYGKFSSIPDSPSLFRILPLIPCSEMQEMTLPAEEVISRHLVTSVLLKTCTAAPPGNWRITFCYHDTIKEGRRCLCSGGICHLYEYLIKGVYLVCRVSASVSAPHRLCNVMQEKAAARKDTQRDGAALKVEPDIFYQNICRGFSWKG